VSSDGEFVFSGGKDGSIIKWSLATGKKLVEFAGIIGAAGEGPPQVCFVMQHSYF
jgi:hypothetical protein